MNNYLLHLLKEVKTLIIPGLGALTITNESTGEILFMPYLKFDDGTLAQHIASKENIDINEAKNIISKFVREVTVELDKGNSYDMYQFGSFVKEDGEVTFKMWNSAGSQSSTTPPPVAETPKEAVKPQPEAKPEPVIEEKKVEPTVEQPIKEETPVAKKEEEKKPEVAPTQKAVVKTEKVVTPSVSPADTSKKKVEKADSKKVKTEKVAKKKETSDGKPKKKVSVFAIILWCLLTILLGGGAYIAWNFDELKKDFPILADLAGENDNAAKGSDDMKNLSEDSLANESEIEPEPIPEDEVEIIETPKPKKEEPKKAEPKKETASENNPTPPANFDGSKRYHIIAGSFGSEENANRLAEKLRSEGLSETAVSFVNGMHRVSIKGYASMQEANADLNTYRSKVNSVWVMKM